MRFSGSTSSKTGLPNCPWIEASEVRPGLKKLQDGDRSIVSGGQKTGVNPNAWPTQEPPSDTYF